MARYPTVPLARGHYESYYLTAHHPTEPRAIWIRSTVLKGPGDEPVGGSWITSFEPDGITALRAVTVPQQTGANLIDVGGSRFADGAADGHISTDHGDASWDVTFSGADPHPHLPKPWMYRAPLPKTKPISLHPVATFAGSASVAGTTIGLKGWRGMVGHNWGAEHAARWIWLHGIGFDGAGDDTWIDVVIGRVGLGPVTTPWSAFGSLSLDGERIRVGGLGKRVTVTERADGCDLRLPTAKGPLPITVSAPAARSVGWRYAGTDGHEHHVFNCSVAGVTMTAGDRSVRTEHGGAYELGVLERDHGRPLAPFDQPC